MIIISEFGSCRQEQLGAVLCGRGLHDLRADWHSSTAVIPVNDSFANLGMSTTTSKVYSLKVVQGATGATPDGYVQSAQP